MKYTANKFKDNNVTVDFNEYVDCEFDGCQIIFKGGNLPIFERCQFNNCQFSLLERADNTLGYLAFLYQNLGSSGGQAFVEEQIAKIKG
jgi:hypothetical protein